MIHLCQFAVKSIDSADIGVYFRVELNDRRNLANKDELNDNGCRGTTLNWYIVKQNCPVANGTRWHFAAQEPVSGHSAAEGENNIHGGGVSHGPRTLPS